MIGISVATCNGACSEGMEHMYACFGWLRQYTMLHYMNQGVYAWSIPRQCQKKHVGFCFDGEGSATPVLIFIDREAGEIIRLVASVCALLL